LAEKQPSYKDFATVGHFPAFSVAPSGEATDRIKEKLVGAKMGRTSSGGGDRGSRAGCRRKRVTLFCLSHFGMTKFVITETL